MKAFAVNLIAGARDGIYRLVNVFNYCLPLGLHTVQRPWCCIQACVLARDLPAGEGEQAA